MDRRGTARQIGRHPRRRPEKVRWRRDESGVASAAVRRHSASRAGLTALCSLMLCGAVPAATEIRWLPDRSGVEVTGVEMSGLPAADAPAEQWAAFLSIRTAGAGLPP